MQALPRICVGSGGSSKTGAFFLDPVGEAGNLALVFLVDVFRDVVEEATALPFLLFLFADGFGPSGDVDMSRSGPLNSLCASVSSFLLRFLLRGCFSYVASAVAATPLSVTIRAGRLSEKSVITFGRSAMAHSHFQLWLMAKRTRCQPRT